MDGSMPQPVTDADFASLSAPPAAAPVAAPVDGNMLTNGSLPPSTYPAVSDPNRDDNPVSNGEIPQPEPPTAATPQPVTDADFEQPSLLDKAKSVASSVGGAVDDFRDAMLKPFIPEDDLEAGHRATVKLADVDEAAKKAAGAGIVKAIHDVPLSAAPAPIAVADMLLGGDVTKGTATDVALDTAERAGHASLATVGEASRIIPQTTEALTTAAGILPAYTDAVASMFTTQPVTSGYDWWNKTMVQPQIDWDTMVKDASQQEAAKSGFVGNLGLMVGGVGGQLGAMFAMGPDEAAERLAATMPREGFPGAVDVIKNALKASAHYSKIPAADVAASNYNSVYKQTGDPMQAVKAGLVGGSMVIVQNSIPLSAEGPLIYRAVSGGLSGVLSQEASRRANNLVMPDNMQTPFSWHAVMQTAMTTATLAGVLASDQTDDHQAAYIRYNGMTDAAAKGNLGAKRALHLVDTLSQVTNNIDSAMIDSADFGVTQANDVMALSHQQLQTTHPRYAAIFKATQGPSGVDPQTGEAISRDAYANEVSVNSAFNKYTELTGRKNNEIKQAYLAANLMAVAHKVVPPSELNMLARWAAYENPTQAQFNQALQETVDTKKAPAIAHAKYDADVGPDGIPNEQAFMRDSAARPDAFDAYYAPSPKVEKALQDAGINYYRMNDGRLAIRGHNTTYTSRVFAHVFDQTGIKPLNPGETYGQSEPETHPVGETPAQENGTERPQGQQATGLVQTEAGQPQQPHGQQDGNEGHGTGVGAGGVLGHEGTGPVAQGSEDLTPRAAPVAAALAKAGVDTAHVDPTGRVVIHPDATPQQATAAIDVAERDAAEHPESDRRPITDKERGNGHYPMGKLLLPSPEGDVPVNVETPKGGIRHSLAGAAKKWSIKARDAIGYIPGTIGADGDGLDVILGPKAYDPSRPVAVISQHDPETGKFDEIKTVMGARGRGEAMAIYGRQYPTGMVNKLLPKGKGNIVMMSRAKFDAYWKSGAVDVPPHPVSGAPLLSLRKMGDFEGDTGLANAPDMEDKVDAINAKHGTHLSYDFSTNKVHGEIPLSKAITIHKSLSRIDGYVGSKLDGEDLEHLEPAGQTETQAVRRGHGEVVGAPLRERGVRAGEAPASESLRSPEREGQEQPVRGNGGAGKHVAFVASPPASGLPEVKSDAPVFQEGHGAHPSSAVGVHYSGKAGLTELDPREAGTGSAGGERRRFGMGNYGRNNPDEIAPRTYFYVRDGNALPSKEAAVAGTHPYEVRLNNLYDSDADLDGIVSSAKNQDEIEEGIHNAGYDGFVQSSPPGMPKGHVAVVLGVHGKIPVKDVGTAYLNKADVKATRKPGMSEEEEGLEQLKKLKEALAEKAADKAKEKLREKSAREVEEEQALLHVGKASDESPDSAKSKQRQVGEGAAAEQPNRATALFEVAPDPHNEELTARFSKLPVAVRTHITHSLNDTITPGILRTMKVGADHFMSTYGGYENEVNPSLGAVFHDGISKEEAYRVASAAGRVFNQDSVIVTGKGMGEKVGVVRIDMDGPKDYDAVRRLYGQLRKDLGDAVGGFTGHDSGIDILNFNDALDTGKLKDDIKASIAKLPDSESYHVTHGETEAHFIGKKEDKNGESYGSWLRSKPENEALDVLRGRATSQLEDAIQEHSGENGQQRTEARTQTSADQAGREASVDRGNREADTHGLREAAHAVLGDSNHVVGVDFVHDEAGLPKDLRNAVQDRLEGKDGKLEGVFDPTTGRVFILTKNVRTPERAAWVTAHEVIGHKGFREWVDAHSDVDVAGRRPVDVLDETVDRTLTNPTVAKMADAITEGRDIRDRREAAQEALAELSAAARTHDWERIQREYGVTVPSRMRQETKGVVGTFMRKAHQIVDAIMAKVTGKQKPFSNEDVRDLIEASHQQVMASERAKALQEARAAGLPDDTAPLMSLVPSILRRSKATLATEPRAPGESDDKWRNRVMLKARGQLKQAVALNKRLDAARQKVGRLDQRAMFAHLNRESLKSEAAFHAAEVAFDKTPEDTNLEQIDNFENDRPITSTAHAAFFNAMKEGFQQRLDEIERLSPGAMDGFIENYYPHEWQDPLKAGKWISGVLSKRPLGGNKNFMKDRYWPTLKAGMDSGLKPVSTNPVDVVLHRFAEMDKFIGLLRLQNTLKARGWLKRMGAGEKVPEGFARVDDPAFEIAGGMQGYYAVPTGIARDINNYLTPGLNQYKGWRAFRAAQNAIVQSELGWSAFHAGFTTLENVTLHLSTAAARFVDRDVVGGVKELLKAPLSIVMAPKEGAMLNKAWRDPSLASPETQAILDALEAGGARQGMSQSDYVQAIPSLLRSIRRGEYGDASLKTLPAVGQAGSWLIHNWLVPNQKMSARVTVFKQLLDHFAGKLGKQKGDYTGILDALSPTAMKQIAAKVVDIVDDRLGQMNYDNQFWNTNLRMAGQASFLSLGWLVGEIRTVTGGVGNIPRLWRPEKLLGALDKAGTITGATMPRLDFRTAYLMMLATVMSSVDAVMQKGMTGHWPRSIKDLFMPPTGRKNPDGSDERVTPPSYWKDHYELVTHPFKTVANKFNPIFSMVYEALTNQDYFGTQVRDPHSPVWKQAMQTGEFFARQMAPFTAINMNKTLQSNDSKWLMAANLVGVNHASAVASRTNFQAFVAHNGNKGYGHEAMTATGAAHMRAMSAAEYALRSGTTPDWTGLTLKDRARATKLAQSEKPELQFKKLDFQDKLEAWDKATPAERREYHLQSILRATNPAHSSDFMRVDPDERAAALKHYRDILRTR